MNQLMDGQLRNSARTIAATGTIAIGGAALPSHLTRPAHRVQAGKRNFDSTEMKAANAAVGSKARGLLYLTSMLSLASEARQYGQRDGSLKAMRSLDTSMTCGICGFSSR